MLGDIAKDINVSDGLFVNLFICHNRALCYIKAVRGKYHLIRTPEWPQIYRPLNGFLAKLY